MRVREPFRFPEEKHRQLQRAKKLSWLTLGWMTSIVVVIYLTMGASQAMRTAFFEDLLALIPPIGFLVATYVEEKHSPSEEFPYGYYRLSTIAFLAAAVTLFAMGLLLLYEAVTVLVKQEHVTIGTVELFGFHLWLGWLMIAANVYAGVVPYILGKKKEPVARELHEKVLYADARLNRADWMTAAAAALGVLGIGLGFWWTDAVAAGIISFDITRDGYTNLKQAVEDLMDDVPTRVGEGEDDPVLGRVRERLRSMDWIVEVQVRLREEGHVITGDAFVVPREEKDLVDRIEQARREVERLDWRLYDLMIIPVRELPEQREPGEEK